MGSKVNPSRPKKMAKQKAVYRVWRALRRISRDRWIPGKDVFDIGIRLARCCSCRPTVVLRKAIEPECEVIGMIQGFAPAHVQDVDYGRYVDFLCDKKQRNDLSVELGILKLTINRRLVWR